MYYKNNFLEDIISTNQIFYYLNPNDNDMLSELNGNDLQDLFILIDDYSLSLRKNLGFKNGITFGFEIEVENVKNFKHMSSLIHNNLVNWKISDDISLNNGKEIISPILNDKEIYWNKLKKACDIIKKYANIDTNSGGHIHIGTQVLGNNKDSWINFIKLWATYENIIYRFSYGNSYEPRSRIENYASPLKTILLNDYKEIVNSNYSLEQILKKISHKRSQAVNFECVKDCNHILDKNTIEFRCPNGSIDPIIWQNNTSLFVNTLLYSKNSGFNNDIIEARNKALDDEYNDLKYYGKIYIDQALEFADMIFSNNLDKIYFLKQYLKSYNNISNKSKYNKSLVKK